MITDLTFTSQSILLSAALIFGFIALTIGLFRLYFKRFSSTPVKEGKVAASRNKYNAVDVHQFRSSFMGLSLVLMLGMTVVAFNWTTYVEEIDLSAYSLDVTEDIEIEPPRSATPPPPPPPPPPPVIQEIPNELIIEEDEMVFVDQSVEAETEVYRPDPIADKETPPPPPPPPPPPAEEEIAEIFKIVEQMPRFPGCEDLSGNEEEKKTCSDKKLMEFIYKNINYPAVARENNIQGTVVLQFVVEKDGSITETKVVRDIGGGCGDEALRITALMQDMPQKWIPGKQRGRPVRVMFNLPIRFMLKEV